LTSYDIVFIEMGREGEPQIGEIDKKIRLNHWLGRFVEGETGAMIGVSVHYAGFPPSIQPKYIWPLTLTSLGLVLAGGGLTVWLKESEKKLQSSIKKTSEESAK